MYRSYNANPEAARVGDCVVRAISKAENKDWEKVYVDLMVTGLKLHDMPSSNNVWGTYLKEKGYIRKIIPNSCPHCYTVDQFCKEHPKGTYILALNGHVVAVENGNLFDTWDSSQENPVFYWEKEREDEKE